MNKEQLIIMYLMGVVYYEHEGLMERVDDAFSAKSGSLRGFAIWDIILYITFYPFYFLVHKIDGFDSEIADFLVMVFNRILWFIFSPIYIVLIVWGLLEKNS